ncbi:MAG: LysR family transcriptional regulator [Hyphomicrobiales bacterium]|nr:LysR family transcriptional regulator [Hyphomicrobiales bacterium]MCP5001973.1 LysR family transcriptional regulator [Hyphomicrobiales bacterium]
MAVSPPRPRGPPLNALRAFEAAARLGGFAVAADELCVTPGAVAQHIKALEEWAGADLFERRSQGVRLTAAGEAITEDFIAAFDRLGEAVQALRSAALPHEVRIAALPSLAQIWLSPRLPEIRHNLPDTIISVTATEQPPNLKREPYDLCLYYLESEQRTANCVVLTEDTIFPVCAPALARRFRTVSDLAGATFLHDATWSSDWDIWLKETAPDAEIETKGPRFSLYALAVEEAVNGAGILIGHEALVAPQIAAGTLVPVFTHPVTLPRSLVLERAKASTNSPVLDKIVAALSQANPFITKV